MLFLSFIFSQPPVFVEVAFFLPAADATRTRGVGEKPPALHNLPVVAGYPGINSRSGAKRKTSYLKYIGLRTGVSYPFSSTTFGTQGCEDAANKRLRLASLSIGLQNK